MKYKRVSLEEALKLRTDLDDYLSAMQAAIEKNDFSSVSRKRLQWHYISRSC